jgi:hypothetical protein
MGQQPQRSGSGSAPSTPTAHNQEEIDSKRAQQVESRDKTLADFMLMLDDYEPLVSTSCTSGRVDGELELGGGGPEVARGPARAQWHA